MHHLAMASYTSSPHPSNVPVESFSSLLPGTPASEHPLERYLEEETRVFFETPGVPMVVAHQPVNTALQLTSQPWSIQSLSSLDSRALSPVSEHDLGLDSKMSMSPFTPEATASSPHLSQVVPPLWPAHEGFRELQLPSRYSADVSTMAGFPSYDEAEENRSSTVKHEIPVPDLSSQNWSQPTDTYHLASASTIDPSLSLAEHSQPVVSSLHMDIPFEGSTRLSLPPQYLTPDNTIYRTEHPRPFIPIISPTKSKRKDPQARRENKQAFRRHRSCGSTAPASPELARTSASTEPFTFPILSSSGTPRPYTCPEPNCPDSYPTSHLLKKHIHTCHRRPFKCIFHYASCPATFTKKNEWKRHVKTQHLVVEYWHCTTGHCRQAQPLHARNSTTSNGVASWGSVFKRKDLYTQHVRRMHLEANPIDKSGEERKLNSLLDKAKKVRCRTPGYMSCPVPSCDKDFRGTKAWEERMEHVAVHLEAAEDDGEDEVVFGSAGDPTLAEWAESDEVDIVRMGEDGELQCWDPLKGCRVTQLSDKD